MEIDFHLAYIILIICHPKDIVSNFLSKKDVLFVWKIRLKVWTLFLEYYLVWRETAGNVFRDMDGETSNDRWLSPDWNESFYMQDNCIFSARVHLAMQWFLLEMMCGFLLWYMGTVKTNLGLIKLLLQHNSRFIRNVSCTYNVGLFL